LTESAGKKCFIIWIISSFDIETLKLRLKLKLKLKPNLRQKKIRKKLRNTKKTK